MDSAKEYAEDKLKTTKHLGEIVSGLIGIYGFTEIRAWRLIATILFYQVEDE